MTYLTIVLLCIASYMIGGITGMATLVILRQAKLEDRRERPLRANASQINGGFIGA